jgi:hypothetical protein
MEGRTLSANYLHGASPGLIMVGSDIATGN